jgi:PKHD-type hydroxylase
MYQTIYNDPWTRAQVIYPYVTWDNAFTDEELQKITEYCDAIGTEIGTTFGGATKEEYQEHRVSNVKFHKRNEETAWIFDRLNFVTQAANEQFYNFHLNGYSEFQYTTYDENGRYDWHVDIALGQRYPAVQPRKLSLSLLLNDNFEGGEFQINEGKETSPTIVPLHKGRIVLFPSFMIHRVTPITKGIRKSIVVWVVGPNFV